MFGVFRGLTSQGRETRALTEFYEELKKNLEIFHVMDQRQFIDMEFLVKQWRMISGVHWAAAFDKVHLYGKTIEEFNAFYREFKSFEKWYASDMANKTRENAQVLHTRRSELEAKLKALYPVICRAGEQIEYKLIDHGLLKQ